MVNSQPPESWDELLAGYVLGDLTPEEVATVNQYLAFHPELVREVNRLQETLALLSLALPVTELPPSLRDRILQGAVGAVPPSLSSVLRSPFPVNWLGVAGTVAAAALIALGWNSYRLRQQLAATQTELSAHRQIVALLRQPNNRLLSLKGVQTPRITSGSLVIAPSQQKAFLTIQNLEPLPQGQVYRLWALFHGKKMDCADFKPNEEGKVWLELPLDRFLADTKSVVITVEPSQLTPEPTGAMVMVGEQSL
jgi:anti-sigma-K factor RskA